MCPSVDVSLQPESGPPTPIRVCNPRWQVEILQPWSRPLPPTPPWPLPGRAQSRPHPAPHGVCQAGGNDWLGLGVAPCRRIQRCPSPRKMPGLLQRLWPPCPWDVAAKIIIIIIKCKIEQSEHFKMGQEASKLLCNTEETSAAHPVCYQCLTATPHTGGPVGQSTPLGRMG